MIAFFVLSGYVMAYVTSTTERTVSIYAAARISRVYSLCLLAVLVTPILDIAGRSFSPEIYAQELVPSNYPFIRILMSLAFLGQTWVLDMATFSNGPYWSLNYEVWYYIWFGLMVF